MSTENQKNPFLLEQRNFSSYNTLVDADNEIIFKTPGLEIYIISEDKFYYWDGSSWVEQNVSGAGGDIEIYLDGVLIDTQTTLDFNTEIVNIEWL